MAKNGVKRSETEWNGVKRSETEWNGTKRIGERSELSAGLERGKGQRHPFSSSYYCSVHFAGRLFFSLFSPTAESGPRLLSWDNTPERRSRFVTLPWKQNFWMTTTRKRHLKSEFALFQTSLILFNFIQFVKCWRNYPGVNPKGPYVSLKKNCFVSHLRHKAGAWN